MSTFPIGTHVRVHSPGYSTHKRTGVVIEDVLKFPWRDHRKVQFDPEPPRVSASIVDIDDLREIKASERPASAAPREQIDLFGGAA